MSTQIAIIKGQLHLTADLAQVREYVEQVFGATAEEVTP